MYVSVLIIVFGFIEKFILGNMHFFPWKVDSLSTRASKISEFNKSVVGAIFGRTLINLKRYLDLQIPGLDRLDRFLAKIDELI